MEHFCIAYKHTCRTYILSVSQGQSLPHHPHNLYIYLLFLVALLRLQSRKRLSNSSNTNLLKNAILETLPAATKRQSSKARVFTSILSAFISSPLMPPFIRCQVSVQKGNRNKNHTKYYACYPCAVVYLIFYMKRQLLIIKLILFVSNWNTLVTAIQTLLPRQVGLQVVIKTSCVSF